MSPRITLRRMEEDEVMPVDDESLSHHHRLIPELNSTDAGVVDAYGTSCFEYGDNAAIHKRHAVALQFEQT